MKSLGIGVRALALVLLLGNAAPARSVEAPSLYAGLHGEVVLDNARVHVEKFVLPAGASTGRHSRATDQLLVFVKGGVLRSAGRSTRWKDGRVLWQSGGGPEDEGSTNVGKTPIVMVSVTFKPESAPPSQALSSKPRDFHVNYPNVSGEDLLENEYVVVQRFTLNPGQWEGVHAVPPNLLYIQITAGQWAERTYKGEHIYPPSPDGEVGWMRTVDLSEGHQSGNVGKKPIDLIWVSLQH